MGCQQHVISLLRVTASIHSNSPFLAAGLDQWFEALRVGEETSIDFRRFLSTAAIAWFDDNEIGDCSSDCLAASRGSRRKRRTRILMRKTIACRCRACLVQSGSCLLRMLKLFSRDWITRVLFGLYKNSSREMVEKHVTAISSVTCTCIQMDYECFENVLRDVYLVPSFFGNKLERASDLKVYLKCLFNLLKLSKEVVERRWATRRKGA
eukprot:766780-Hanusia_phi.AAC.1